MSDNFIVTISRQYGSGGRELANILAKKLNIKLYDRQIVHAAAIKLGYDHLDEQDIVELENNLTAYPSSIYLPFRSFGSQYGESSTSMFLSESQVIHQLAEKNSCVILGRSADYILRKNVNVFSIFVCADDEYREKRALETYGGKTLKELNAEDEKRARYYNYYTGKTWGHGSSYDLVVNTSKEPLEVIADGIIAYIKATRHIG